VGEGRRTHYCNHELDAFVEQQSMEGDPQKRKTLVWQIDN
jgi:hypothetical protein